MDAEGLLSEEDDRWRELLALFDSIPKDRIDQGGVTSEDWSPKDVMYHLGAWLSECTTVLDRLDAGAPVVDDDLDGDTDQKNAAWFNMGRGLDAKTVRADLEAAREAARERFARIENPSQQAWNWFEESGPVHYVEHGRDLRAWLEAPAR
jgi:hypothetical protein